MKNQLDIDGDVLIEGPTTDTTLMLLREWQGHVAQYAHVAIGGKVTIRVAGGPGMLPPDVGAGKRPDVA